MRNVIVMGARGYSPDGSGGEIAIYLSKRIREHPDGPVILLRPSRFSYWLFNTWVRAQRSINPEPNKERRAQ